MILKRVLFWMLVGWSVAQAKILTFGAITTVKPEIVCQHFLPLFAYLERELGVKLRFATGRDYDDTIDKFINGSFDLGYIGPSPYVLAIRKAPGSLRLIAGVQSDHNKTFQAVIVARKDSKLESLDDLAGKRFAFGSRRSTLSFYLPYYMLLKAGVLEKLARYDLLGRHDIVAKNVIMGRYDAGGIKRSVALRYQQHLKKIALSQPVTDFAIVAHRSLDPTLAKKIQQALFRLKDPKILHAIKPDMSSFVPRKDAEYDALRKIMEIVDRHFEGSGKN